MNKKKNKKNKKNPHNRIVFIWPQQQTTFKTSHKKALFSSHCAFLSNILVKYPCYLCCLANLIKLVGF